MKKKQLRKSEIRELNDAISSLYGISPFSKNDSLEFWQGERRLIVGGGEPQFFYANGVPVPTLKFCQKQCVLPRVTVDMGAVKFVSNGADIMRPGIVSVEEFSKGDHVAVVDERNGVSLAVCEALADSSEIEDMESGKVLKNIHYVGDEIWLVS